MAAAYVLIIILVIGLLFLFASVKVAREYERGVIFRLGRLIAQKGPGLILLIPFIDQMVKVDLRTVTLNVPPQEVITKDNVTVRVNAVAYFRVIDPNKAIVRGRELPPRHLADRADDAALGARQGRARRSCSPSASGSTSACSRSSTSRPSPGASRSPRSRSRTSSCRRRCSGRSPARPRPSASGGPRSSPPRASSRRPRSSPRRPTSSAPNPATLQLRYLQTLLEIGSNQNTTLILPFPVEMLEALGTAFGGARGGGNGAGRPPG